MASTSGKPSSGRHRQTAWRVDRLDVAAFAEAGGRLEGLMPWSELSRLADSVIAPPVPQEGAAASATAPLNWRLVGSHTRRSGQSALEGASLPHLDPRALGGLKSTGQPGWGRPQITLELTGELRVEMTCQRCLEPVQLVLPLHRRFVFVASEAEAERLDDDIEDDVLVLHTAFNAKTLIEDEALLALPLVPRHGTCPTAFLTESAASSRTPGDDGGPNSAVASGTPTRRSLAGLGDLWLNDSEQRTDPRDPSSGTH